MNVLDRLETMLDGTAREFRHRNVSVNYADLRALLDVARAAQELADVDVYCYPEGAVGLDELSDERAKTRAALAPLLEGA